MFVLGLQIEKRLLVAATFFALSASCSESVWAVAPAAECKVEIAELVEGPQAPATVELTPLDKVATYTPLAIDVLIVESRALQNQIIAAINNDPYTNHSLLVDQEVNAFMKTTVALTNDIIKSMAAETGNGQVDNLIKVMSGHSTTLQNKINLATKLLDGSSFRWPFAKKSEEKIEEVAQEIRTCRSGAATCLVDLRGKVFEIEKNLRVIRGLLQKLSDSIDVLKSAQDELLKDDRIKNKDEIKFAFGQKINQIISLSAVVKAFESKANQTIQNALVMVNETEPGNLTAVQLLVARGLPATALELEVVKEKGKGSDSSDLGLILDSPIEVQSKMLKTIEFLQSQNISDTQLVAILEELPGHVNWGGKGNWDDIHNGMAAKYTRWAGSKWESIGLQLVHMALTSTTVRTMQNAALKTKLFKLVHKRVGEALDHDNYKEDYATQLTSYFDDLVLEVLKGGK